MALYKLYAYVIVVIIPLPCLLDKYPKFIGSHLTSTINIQNRYPLIPTSDTPSIYKGLEYTRYPGEKRSLQYVLRSKSKESIVYQKKIKLGGKSTQADTTL